MWCSIDAVRSVDNLWAADIAPASKTIKRRRVNQTIKSGERRSKRRRGCYSSSTTENTSSVATYCRLVAAAMKLLSFLSAAPRVRASFANTLSCGGRSFYSLPHQPRTSALISNSIQGSHSHRKMPSMPPSTIITARSYTSKNKPDEFDDLSSYDATFNLSGYQRPKVNWYPGHIAK